MQLISFFRGHKISHPENRDLILIEEILYSIDYLINCLSVCLSVFCSVDILSRQRIQCNSKSLHVL